MTQRNEKNTHKVEREREKNMIQESFSVLCLKFEATKEHSSMDHVRKNSQF
jgi:hypothetical protein